MHEVLKDLGEIEVQFKLLEAKKNSLLKKALEILAHGQPSQNSEAGKAETTPEPAEKN